MHGDIERLMTILSRLPGMGGRSASRIVIHMLKKKHTVMETLLRTMGDVFSKSKTCQICNNIDMSSPCHICSDPKRDQDILCVVSDISDLWSIERSEFFRGKYHVIGGKLSAIDGVRPEDLDISGLCKRVSEGGVKEVIIAMSADLDGQTTMFFINDYIKKYDIKITTLSKGVPIGGELDHLDDGTIMTAFEQRHNL